MASPRQGPVLSSDGRWSWNGSEWTSTLSPDGHWIWNGTQWNPVPHMRRYWRWDGDRWVRRVKAMDRLKNLPTWLVWSLALWIPLLVAWIPAVMVVASHHDSRALVISVAAWAGGTAVVATIAFGASLGYRRQWGYLAWSFLAGMVTAGLVIFFAFAGSQPVNAPDDPGLGIGATLVTVALAPVVVIVLSLGGGLGWLARRLRN